MESEPGIELDASLRIPASPGPKPAVLLLAGALSNQLAERFARKGRVVLVLEPRRSVKYDDRRPYVGDWLANTRAEQIGVPLPGSGRATSARHRPALRLRRCRQRNIRAAAQGVKGIWLLLAAAVDPRIRKVWLDKAPYSFSEALHNTLNTNLSDAVIPGFSLHWDLDGLTKRWAIAPCFGPTPPTG